MAQTSSIRGSTRRKMVRKQVYIFPHQEARLKAMAQEQLVSEADLIRQAVDAFLEQPPAHAAGSLPPDEAAWQEILSSFAEVGNRSVPGEAHRWTREDYYDEPRHQ